MKPGMLALAMAFEEAAEAIRKGQGTLAVVSGLVSATVHFACRCEPGDMRLMRAVLLGVAAAVEEACDAEAGA